MARGVGGQGPANIMAHIRGLKFPASKRQILQHIEQGEGPDTEDAAAASFAKSMTGNITRPLTSWSK